MSNELRGKPHESSVSFRQSSRPNVWFQPNYITKNTVSAKFYAEYTILYILIFPNFVLCQKSKLSFGRTLLVGAATCSEGFVICFLKVPHAYLGSMAAAVQPNSLETLRKHFTKPSEQVAAPPSSAQ